MDSNGFFSLSSDQKKIQRIIFHDILNPVSSIQNWAYLLEKNSDTAEIAQKIKDNVSYIDDYLSFVREMLEFSPESLKKVWTSLSMLVKDALAECSEKIQRKKIEVEFNVEEDVSLSLDSDVYYKRVVYPIIDNAIRFSPEGCRITISLGIESMIITNDVKQVCQKTIGNLFNVESRTVTPCVDGSLGLGLSLYFAKFVLNCHQQSILVDTEGSSLIVKIEYP